MLKRRRACDSRRRLRRSPSILPRVYSPLTQNCDPPSADQEDIRGYNNRFYTANANASATCDCCGLRPLAMLPKGLEDNFTSSKLPSADTIIAWGRSKLGLPV